MSLRNQTPLIHNYDMTKSYNRILNKRFNNNCCYINKYGVKCENVCLKSCIFILREYYCEYHIKNYIDDIIKINIFIYNFILNEDYINKYLLNTYIITQFQLEKVKYKDYLKKIYKLLHHNYDYILMTQPILDIIYTIAFRYFQNDIYDMDTFKINANLTKNYKFNYIVNYNKKYRKDTIDILISLSNKKETTIGKVFLSSKIADHNIFKIIESFI